MPSVRPSRSAGFTLLELMVTLAIVAVLGLLTVPVLQISVQRAKEQELRTALHEIRGALDAYKRAAEANDIEVPPEASGYPPNLEMLVSGVPWRDPQKKGKLYLLRRLPRDPMNPQTELSPVATWGQRSYASEASDPQSGADVFDVYSLSNKLGLNGIPYSAW